MSRTVTMEDTGNFTVSDDPEDVIAMALLIATAPQHINDVQTALAPDGKGFDLETFGMIYRIDDRAELVPPFNEDTSVDPETQELWMLVRDRDRRQRRPLRDLG